MGFKNTADQYGALAKSLHWLSAVIVLCLLVVGYYMVGLENSPFKFELYWWHKSFGILIFMIVALRLIWRFVSPVPAHLPNHKPWERALAKLTHVLLYLGMIGMPISGWVMSSAADFPQEFFGLFSLPDFIDQDQDLFRKARTAHGLASYMLYAAIGLHALGAFKHHIIDKDTTLKRMLPGHGTSAWLFPIGFFFVLMMSMAGSFLLLHELNEGHENQGQYTEETVVKSAVDEIAPVEEIQGQDDYFDAPKWTIDKEASAIKFSVPVYGKTFEGQFTDFRGDIYFDPENVDNSRVDIFIRTDSVQSGSKERDDYIVQKPWMNAESFPESYFSAYEFKKIDENQYVAFGELTIKGTKLPVELPFTLTIDESESGESVAHMQGELTLERLAFNVGAGQWSDTETVGNQVTVKVSVQAQRDGGT